MEAHLQARRLAVSEAGWRELCAPEDIPDGESRAFAAPPGGFVGLFAVRRGPESFVYVNSCPHIGLPLDWAPGKFLSSDGTKIICANHGAAFTIADGRCTIGPCLGERLERVMIQIKHGRVLVPETAGL